MNAMPPLNNDVGARTGTGGGTFKDLRGVRG